MRVPVGDEPSVSPQSHGTQFCLRLRLTAGIRGGVVTRWVILPIRGLPPPPWGFAGRVPWDPQRHQPPAGITHWLLFVASTTFLSAARTASVIR